jgi:peptidoglycan/LPS O-acetylase OafA/YrhL
VDVFFVISGYLITGIIVGRAEAGRFSLGDFYARRIRRIFPALAVVLVACAVLGWRVLYASEFRLLGNHVAAGAGFANNILLWAETGYFDPAAETKPLLHLWSLGVEEQFYLVWPVVLAYACRTARARRMAVVAVLVVSFAACVWMTARHPVAAFYLPFFRFWELMAGAIFAVRPAWNAASPRDANVRSIAGAALLAASLVLIDRSLPFPGWRAAIPVAGTCLLLSAGRAGVVNRWLLSLRALVFIGLISYPLYLWHWPLLTFVKILSNNATLTFERGAVLFGLSVALAWLTYRLVETPVRTGASPGRKAIAALVAMVIVGIAGATVSLRQGYPERAVNSRDPTFETRDGRFAADVREWQVDECAVTPTEAKVFRRCTRDTRGTARFALIGDSKAESLWAGLVRTSGPQGRWMFIGGSTDSTSVLPVLSDQWHYESYREPSSIALRALEQNREIDTVVIAAAARAFFHLATADSIEDLPVSPFFDDARDGFTRYVKRLTDAGKKVVIVVDNPTLPDPKRCMKDARVTWHGKLARFFAIGEPDRRCEVTLARHEELSAPYRRLLSEVKAVAPGRVTLFETVPHLCDTAQGRCGIFDQGRFLYSFADHISDEAATRIGKALNAALVQ